MNTTTAYDQDQPDHRSPSWIGIIREQRKQFQERMFDSPSLQLRFGAGLEDSDLSATLLAAGETGLPETRFPATCPFSAEQLLDEGYWLEAGV